MSEQSDLEKEADECAKQDGPFIAKVARRNGFIAGAKWQNKRNEHELEALRRLVESIEDAMDVWRAGL